MVPDRREVIFYSEFHIPHQFRQCAACFQTEYETGIPLRTCSRCRVTHYCDDACQKRHFPSHKEPCLRRRKAIRQKERHSPDLKWRPLARAGNEGASLVPYIDLEKAFMCWSQVQTPTIDLLVLALTGQLNFRKIYESLLGLTIRLVACMRRSEQAGFQKCLRVKLSGHRDTSDHTLRFKVANIDTVFGIDLLRKWGALEGPFAEVRAKQRYVDGIFVFAVLLECGPVIHFMPIGAPRELLQTWEDDPEWKEVFLHSVVDS